MNSRPNQDITNGFVLVPITVLLRLEVRRGNGFADHGPALLKRVRSPKSQGA